MLVFGFDIGTTSVGSAVIRLEPETGRGSILRLGVRIFPEARDPDETPLNQQRRAKRMMRRQVRRRKDRRRTLNEALTSAGLLPPFSSAKESDWASVMASDPYALRKKGLSEALTPHELGRALYHLAKRRHFKGRELEPEEKEKDQDAEEKKAQTSREGTLGALRAANTTLGDWLASKPPGERKRGIHATRDVVEDEFRKLWIAQGAHHPKLREAGFIDEIENIVFAQKPVFWRTSTLGECRLEPGAPLCPKASWLSQQRRMLEKLNNLAIAGGNARLLDEEERAAILANLQTQGSMSWPGVRRALEPLFKRRDESTKSIKFNLEIGDEKGGLLGNPLEAKLATIFGDEQWSEYPRKEELRERLPELLWDADYGLVGSQRVVIRREAERKARRQAIRDKLIHDFGVSPTQADGLIRVSLPTGWEPYSTKALRKILPELERGTRFGTLMTSPETEWVNWRSTNFPNREQPTGEIHDKLPSPADREESRRIAQLRNPTVVRTQNELRKVVNNLIGLYGKPDLIRVELARDVGKSKREREEISSAIRKREIERKRAKSDLESKEIMEPSEDDIEKWLLWKEGQERCPYTGDQICFDDLFRRGQYQVEHIWPKSRSLDNSFRNKTLCREDVNKAKGNRTPNEFFSHRADEWNAIKDRLDRMLKSGNGLSAGKIKRFLAEKIPEDFANRQLTDTSYAARQAIGFLQRLWPDVGQSSPVRVQAVSGRVTAQLRKRWGLNYILGEDGEKTRADHRHHAIDALVVACAQAGYVKRLSDYYQDEERNLKPPHLPEPWPEIRKDAETEVNKIIVSHRVRKKISGPLHKETVYRDTRRDIRSDGIDYRVISQRVSIRDLTPADLSADNLETNKQLIADAEVRRLLREHVTRQGGDLLKKDDIKKAFASFPRMGEKGPEIRSVHLESKRQPSLLKELHNGLSDPESKHHVAIFKLSDGSYDGQVVSLYDAARRISVRESPVQRHLKGGGGKFVMSLCKGDSLQLNGSKKGVWVVREIKSNKQITLAPHTEARATKGATIFKPTINGLMNCDIQKLSVDPIGRCGHAGD